MKNGKTISSPPSIPPITASNGAVPAEWHYPLHVSLDTLYTGAKLRYRVTRYLLTGQTQESYVDIEVKPGWRKGTKIRFAGLGNERAPPQPPQDVIFIVDEIPHPRFRREGSNLYTTVDISLLDALSETRHVIQGLDGKDIIVDVDFAGGLIRPGDVTRIPGKGMPIRKNSQVVGQGDLTIRWNVVFPDSLSERQRRFIRMARDEDRDDRTS
ncbi:uncharacterized protein EI90DRAFT_2946499 [Cantharellus anzutake]|uniref:uncharacterized protein n=1 Tax=Cantharellus anzutake TaxID=1750568 RepID=UPI001905D9D0|nr:uncharacterized protein EI90DRAFT_2946499 [Cantharellus anzutake]KAF8315475.1 hypothetical protein EI90DRAFT_2946499 [Cantharellus anzutake]